MIKLKDRCKLSLAKMEAIQETKELRDSLRYRRDYGLRIPRKMKKRAKRYIAEDIGHTYGVPTNKVLRLMKKAE